MSFSLGIGGSIGAITRYLLSTLIQREMTGTNFPLGTLVVNVVGCFIIGVLSYFQETRDAFSTETLTFFMVGVLGGFTTFSAFGHETVSLLRAGQTGSAVANITAHLVLAVGAVWLGRAAGMAVWR